MFTISSTLTRQGVVRDVDDVATGGELRSVVVLISNCDGEVHCGGSRFRHTAVLCHQSEVVDVGLFSVQGDQSGDQTGVTVHCESLHALSEQTIPESEHSALVNSFL